MFTAKQLFKDPDQFREEIERLGAITVGSLFLNGGATEENLQAKVADAKKELTVVLDKHGASVCLLTFLDLLHKLTTTTEEDVKQAVLFHEAKEKTTADA